MKSKILLIIIVILFAVSCAKNNPSNPTQNNNSSGGSTGSNTSENENTGINNYGDTEDIPSVNIDDGSIEFEGNAKLTIKTLDDISLVEPEDINIYVDIYEKDKIARVHIPNIFDFSNILLDNTKHTYYSSDEKGNYTLTMKVGNDSITEFQFIILSKVESYKYYIESEKLSKIQKN
ncbi:hypothetical protein [Brachyspira hampsonii]|uniref:hypothetical protein n=1 Tax=Brachyspira hampsonii TaxID=1287055 RepID=UPI000D35F3B2|nr:hypothetical protein [Brachyspira hampsonii]PTY39158.1 hypothetical protein DQ06_00495 [Brachyspira hampsonii bv. II]